MDWHKEKIEQYGEYSIRKISNIRWIIYRYSEQITEASTLKNARKLVENIKKNFIFREEK